MATVMVLILPQQEHLVFWCGRVMDDWQLDGNQIGTAAGTSDPSPSIWRSIGTFDSPTTQPCSDRKLASRIIVRRSLAVRQGKRSMRDYSAEDPIGVVVGERACQIGRCCAITTHNMSSQHTPSQHRLLLMMVMMVALLIVMTMVGTFERLHW